MRTGFFQFFLSPVALAACLSFPLADETASAQERDDPSNRGEPPPVEIFGPPPPRAPEVLTRDANGRATLRATRLDEPIVVDGKLDDAVYSTVPPFTDFIQQEPNEGELATEQTEAWIFFDDRHVYVAARCWDSHPERIVANEMRRDHDGLNQNSNFVVAFDPFYDRRNGFYFQTNPLGAIRDLAIMDEGLARNTDWNTVWDAKASWFENGWTLEMAIPFKSLRYRRMRDQIWGVQMRRTVRWKNEVSYISPIPAAYGGRGIHRYSEAATLVGIEVPLSSRNIELKPYGLSSLTTDNTAEEPFSNEVGGDAGFDAKYGITNGLVADFTYNTDFAQIEEDEEEINLTRFSLFFPEKRDFFLEGQGIFAFGGIEDGSARRARRGNANNDLTPILFFSRRIGLTDFGIDPIRVGGRVTGRAGAYRIGALNIGTRGDAAAGIPATNFSVFRLRRDILRRSDIGFIATHRTTSLTEGADANSVVGFDGNFAFYQNVRLNGFFGVSRTPPLEGTEGGFDDDATTYSGKFDYGADRYGLTLEHLKVGSDFRPELGFLRREAFRRNFASARFSPRPRSIEWIRRLVFESELDHITDNDGRLETRRIQGTFRIEHENGDRSWVDYTNDFEYLPEEFEISDGIVLPVAEYRFQDVRVAYEFGPQRVVPGTLSFRTGGFFDGDRQELSYDGRVEVTSQFAVEPRVALNWVDLVEGSFTAKLVSARVSYAFTPRTFVSSLVQFNSSSDSFSGSVRFRWEYEPGSDFFIVYSEGWNELSGDSFLATRTLAFKLTKLFRF
ncbi:MAG TPA: DUF5916 domain-containing protein [Vicinamibacteria bacterium]|nr:DUF5916 domain-containing protein [Vicinamibacteria bacterium]